MRDCPIPVPPTIQASMRASKASMTPRWTSDPVLLFRIPCRHCFRASSRDRTSQSALGRQSAMLGRMSFSCLVDAGAWTERIEGNHFAPDGASAPARPRLGAWIEAYGKAARHETATIEQVGCLALMGMCGATHSLRSGRSTTAGKLGFSRDVRHVDRFPRHNRVNSPKFSRSEKTPCQVLLADRSDWGLVITGEGSGERWATHRMRSACSSPLQAPPVSTFCAASIMGSRRRRFSFFKSTTRKKCDDVSNWDRNYPSRDLPRLPPLTSGSTHLQA